MALESITNKLNGWVGCLTIYFGDFSSNVYDHQIEVMYFQWIVSDNPILGKGTSLLLYYNLKDKDALRTLKNSFGHFCHLNHVKVVGVSPYKMELSPLAPSLLFFIFIFLIVMILLEKKRDINGSSKKWAQGTTKEEPKDAQALRQKSPQAKNGGAPYLENR